MPSISVLSWMCRHKEYKAQPIKSFKRKYYSEHVMYTSHKSFKTWECFQPEQDGIDVSNCETFPWKNSVRCTMMRLCVPFTLLRALPRNPRYCAGSRKLRPRLLGRTGKLAAGTFVLQCLFPAGAPSRRDRLSPVLVGGNLFGVGS